MMSMINDGVVLYSVTKHGEVEKENPQCKVFNQTTIQIAKYADILGLSVKSMTPNYLSSLPIQIRFT